MTYGIDKKDFLNVMLYCCVWVGQKTDCFENGGQLFKAQIMYYPNSILSISKVLWNPTIIIIRMKGS
jgi:hypothetical protein